MKPRYNMQKALMHYARITELRQDQNYLLADDMVRLNETDLTPKDLYRICCKVQKAAYLSAEPFLHGERVDAARYLLEYGLGNSRIENRFFYLPKLTQEQAKDFLLNASLTEVRTLIDIVASENRDLYSVERGIDLLDTADGQTLLTTLTAFANKKQSLDIQMHTAKRQQLCQEVVSDPEKTIPPIEHTAAQKDPTR